MTKILKRRELRIKVLQILYAFEMNGEGLSSNTEGILTDVKNEEDKEFCRILVNKIIANRKVIDQKISSRVDNWELNRIALIDKLLLRIGIGELMFMPDIPPKVSINEVIEIAKNFSNSNSGKFINGILDSIMAELKESGQLNKLGRGLIEETTGKKSSGDDEDEE